MKQHHLFTGWPKLALFAALFARIASAESASEHSTHYRYRAFEGTNEPEFVSSYTSPAANLPPLGIITRGSSSDAFQNFWYGKFGPGRYYICGDDVLGNDLSGDFTVTAFLQLLSADPAQTICSTLPNGSTQSGFRFSVANGFLKAETWFTLAAGGRANRSIVSPQPLTVNQWYRVVFRVYKNSDDEFQSMQLWIDSEMVQETSLPYGDAVAHSSLNPILGADRDTVNGVLRANVHSIQVDDYALSEFFLETPIIQDGSRSFGIPSYHDYLGLASDPHANGKPGGDPLERRIYNTWNDDNYGDFRQRLVDRCFTPFLNDGYIPQGVAYDKANNRLFISMYYHQVEEADDINPNNYPSLVVEIFLADKRMGNVFKLKTAGGDAMAAHVGGLAYWNKCLFVPNANQLYIYDISAVPVSQFDPATLTGFSPRSIEPVQTMTKTEVFGSATPFDSIAFLDLREVDPTNAYLCLGDWESGEKQNIIERSLKYAAGVFSFTSSRTLLETNPDAQGFAVYARSDSTLRGFLSTSGSTSDSQLIASTYPGAIKTGNVGQTGTSSLVLKGPLGFEDLQLVNSQLWTVSESGGQYYQKRNGDKDPWDHLFPFIFGMEVGDITSPIAKVAAPSPALRLASVATLGRIDSAHPMIAGFVIETSARRLLIRAVGPGLSLSFGLPGSASDPQFTLNRIDGPTSGIIGNNDNWNVTDAAVMAQVGAFPLAPGSKDAAMVATFQPGIYTAIVSSADNQAGQTLVEIYDVDPTIPGGLVAFSTRGWIGPGGSLTPGIAAVGTGSILVRAVGPTLTSTFGLPNTLADPRLELWPNGAAAATATNDDWSATYAAAMARVGEFPLVPGSKDAALIIDTNGQNGTTQMFTLLASGLASDQGECLVEVYILK